MRILVFLIFLVLFILVGFIFAIWIFKVLSPVFFIWSLVFLLMLCIQKAWQEKYIECIAQRRLYITVFALGLLSTIGYCGGSHSEFNCTRTYYNTQYGCMSHVSDKEMKACKGTGILSEELFSVRKNEQLIKGCPCEDDSDCLSDAPICNSRIKVCVTSADQKQLSP